MWITSMGAQVQVHQAEFTDDKSDKTAITQRQR